MNHLDYATVLYCLSLELYLTKYEKSMTATKERRKMAINTRHCNIGKDFIGFGFDP